jgi:hypothetical protein
MPFFSPTACSVLAENSGGKYRFTALGLDHVVFAEGKFGSYQFTLLEFLNNISGLGIEQE